MLFLIILYIYCRSWYLLRLKGISPVITHKQTGSDVYMHLSLPKLLSCILIIVFLCSLTTYEWQIKGKTNIHCLSKVLGHHVLPEQLQCTLALILQVSELYWKDEHHPSKRYSLIGVLTMLMENAV